MTELNQTTDRNNDEYRGPDYIAKQYRRIRVEDGWKTLKERIGVAYANDNGSICFRPSGAQLITGDVHLFLREERD